jgi:hypothetical protein
MNGTYTTFVGVGLLALAGCSGADTGGAGDMIGEATFALAAAPTDASCLQIVVTGTRTVTRLIDLMPGQSTVFTLNGLPLGNDTFTESAFAQTCGQVTPSSVATWASDPTAATLQAGITASVTVVLRRNGKASVTSDFQDDTPACMPPLQFCTSLGMSGCVDVTSNAANCGACGFNCPPAPNSVPVCVGSTCQIQCNPGFADCDGQIPGGCETNTQIDSNNCGGCGVRCPRAANSTPLCTNGACQLVCNPGFLDCDGDPANGCESRMICP